ncbi:MAG: cadherin-like beta sandwich domain-containing protein, partial [Gammaproteobacteria bacterium]|nr:cadherin-like beta sandwich domain-containing protein [Gammaproteobacteria bacterium]
TEYDIQVRAENINGESAWSSSQTATTGDEADATLSALAADGSDSVALVFTPVFDAETEEYTAQMGRDSTSVAFTATFAQSGASATIAFDGGTAAAITSGTAATAQNVAAGGETTAEIVVTASDGATTKTYTVIVRRDPAAPGAPTGVTASAGPRAGTATLTWSAPANTGGVPLVDFRVRWRTAGAGGSAAGAWQNLAGEHLACNSILIEDHKDCGESVAPDQTRYTVTGLGGVAYDFAVGAVNSGGIGDWVEVEFTPTAERDPHLSALTATDSEGADAALSPAFSAEVFAYTASVPNVAGSATITATPAGDNATFTVKIGGADAVAGTSGQASAAGIIDKGATVPFVVETAAETGGATATYRVDITRQPGVAGAPQNVAANDDEVTGAANITWAPPADLGDVTVDATSISSYRIRWRTAGNDGPDGVSGNTDDVAAGAWQDAAGDDAECNDTDATNDADCGEATSGGAAHVLSGLTDGTPYDISLAAVNAHGIGAWSEEVRVTTSADADATLANLEVVGADASAPGLVKTGAQTSAGFAQKYVTYKADISAALTAVRIRPTASADGVLLTRRATRLSPAVDAATGAIDTSQLTRSSLRLFNPRQTSGVNSELFAIPLGGALEYEITVRAKNGDTRAYTLVVNRPLGGAPVPSITGVELGDFSFDLLWDVGSAVGVPVTGFVIDLKVGSRSWLSDQRGSPVIQVSDPTARRRDDITHNQSRVFDQVGVRIASVTPAGRSGWSHGRTVRLADAVPPAKPTEVRVSDPSSTSLTVAWEMPAKNRAEITHYGIRWRTAGNDGPDGVSGNSDDVAPGNWQGNTAAAGDPVVIGDSDDGVEITAPPASDDALSYTVSGSAGNVGDEVEVAVRARNSKGAGEWSDPVAATLQNAANADLSALVINDGSGDLTLTKTGDVTTDGFDAAHLTYETADVATAIAEITLTATPVNAGASLTLAQNAGAGARINGGEAQTLALAPGDNAISVKVVSADGTSDKTYSVAVHRTRPPLAFAESQADLRFYADGAAISEVVLAAAADSGTPPYSYALDGDLPDSLAFAAETRILSGTADAVTSLETATLTYTLSDAAATPAEVAQTFEISLAPPLEFAAEVPSALTFGATRDANVVLPELSGGFAPYHYRLEGSPRFTMFVPATRTIGGIASSQASSGTMTYYANDDYGENENIAAGRLSRVIAWTIVLAAPSAPTNFAVAAANERLQLSWGAPVIHGGDFTDNFRVRWRTAATDGPDGIAGNTDDVAAGAWQNSSGDSEDGENVGNVLRYQITGLTNSTVYEAQVAAENSVGVGDWSSAVEATPADVLAFAALPPDLRFFASRNTAGAPASSALSAAESGTEGSGYTYAMTGLPSGLSFNATTRQVEISGDIADSTRATEVTYTVTDNASPTPATNSVKFNIVIDSADVDRSGAINAADGIMLARRLLGVTGDALTAGQSRAGADAVERRIQTGTDQLALDADGDGAVDENDGLLLARYLLGLRGAALVAGIGSLAEGDASGIESNIAALLPSP